jgi:transposase-like protein
MRSENSRRPEAVFRGIRREPQRELSPEEKIRVAFEGLKGEESISEICRREDITSSLYYRWSKAFLEAGKKRLKGDPEGEQVPQKRALGWRPGGATSLGDRVGLPTRRWNGGLCLALVPTPLWAGARLVRFHAVLDERKRGTQIRAAR